MTTFDRRSLMAATAATVTATEGRGCTKPYDWETMSLEDRNLAFNNVAHVTPEFAQKKTEEWTAATRKLREQRPQHLNLAYGPGERNKWDLYPASDPKAPCLVHIHGGYWQRGPQRVLTMVLQDRLLSPAGPLVGT
jgi:arylformamidase